MTSAEELERADFVRCAECDALVARERVKLREERIKVARVIARWGAAPRPGGALAPPRHQPPPGPGSRRFARFSYRTERVPVCLDCLRRQRFGLLGVCGVAALCLVAGALVYSQDEAPSRDPHQVALATPGPTTAVARSGVPAGMSTTATTAPMAAAPVSPKAATVGSAPPADSATEQLATTAAPPIWKPEHKAVPRKAARAFHRPPEPDNALALRASGYNELRNHGYAQAFWLLRQATALGDAYAPMYIGQMFEDGLGVARDVGQASYWYGIAIDRGNAAALAAFNRLRQNPY